MTSWCVFTFFFPFLQRIRFTIWKYVKSFLCQQKLKVFPTKNLFEGILKIPPSLSGVSVLTSKTACFSFWAQSSHVTSSSFFATFIITSEGYQTSFDCLLLKYFLYLRQMNMNWRHLCRTGPQANFLWVKKTISGFKLRLFYVSDLWPVIFSQSDQSLMNVERKKMKFWKDFSRN